MSAQASPLAHPHPLGDRLSVHVEAHPAAAECVEAAVTAEISRLEAVFDLHDPDSEYARWRLGLGEEVVSPDLATVLTASERFWVFSRGSFHPGAEPLLRRWREAEATGVEPSRAEMRALADRLQLPYTAMAGPVRRIGDCSAVELSPLVRGYMLDCAIEAGWALGLASSIVLDAGDRVCHRGADGVRVDVAEFVGADEASGHRVLVRDAALSRVLRPADASASAGGFIDPHTGWPNRDVTAAVALAPDAVTAEVAAGLVGVRPGGGDLPGCAWLAVGSDGRVTHSENWPG